MILCLPASIFFEIFGQGGNFRGPYALAFRKSLPRHLSYGKITTQKLDEVVFLKKNLLKISADF